MGKHFITFCVLSAGILCAQNPPALRSWAEAGKLEADLPSHPDDLHVHEQLLVYYGSQRSESASRATPLRRIQILWFVEHHPEHSLLSTPLGTLEQADDPEGYQQCRAAWDKALAATKPLFDTISNAIFFFKTSDSARARRIAEEGLARYPGNAHITEKLGLLMAYTITGVTAVDFYGRATSFAETPGAQAARDLAELESSDDPNLLSGAARGLEPQAYTLHAQHRTAQLKEIEELIIRLYEHADRIDPNSQRWKMSAAMAYNSLAFYTDAPAERSALLEKALAAAASQPGVRSAIHSAMAQHYLSVGESAKAAAAANALLESDLDKSDRAFGDFAYMANIILGRIALQQADAKEAARRLLAAVQAPNPVQLISNGPHDWILAQDLLSAGERDSVLAYLDLLRGIWKSGAPRIATWISTIRAGGIPSFTGPSDFPRERYIGRPAPDFTLKDLKGHGVTLASFKGKVVLLDFWATWCGPCRAEMPDLQRMHAAAAEDFAVLTIDVNEDLATVAEYMQKEKFTFPVLLASGTDVMKRFGVNAYPTTFFIDKNGLVSDVIVGGGADSEPRLRTPVEAARKGAPAPAPGSSPAPAAAPSGGPPLPSTATAEDLYRDAVRRHGVKDYDGAVQALDRALESRPEWLQAITARADAFYHAKRYDEALAGFNRAIQLDPNRAASYDARGLVYSYSGHHDKAIPDYSRAIDLQPTLTVAYNNRGWANLELGRLDESLADLNKALDLNPAYVVALNNRAHLFEKREEYAKAIADYDAVLRMEPANSSATREKTIDERKLLPSILPPAAAPEGAVTVVGEPSQGNCLPFGCPWMLTAARPALLAYQQVYDASAFGTKPISITALTFYAKLGRGHYIVPGNYTFRLALTPARVGKLGHDRLENLARDATIVWSGDLQGEVNGSFTVTAEKPFRFDPGAGDNLILDIAIVTKSPVTIASQAGGFFDRDKMNSLTTSRAVFSSETNGSNNGSGLVTGFTLR